MEELSLNKSLLVNRVFTPATPIEQKALFAGRVDQIKLVLNAIAEPGRHVIVYGLRGVGKTSFVNTLVEFFPEDFPLNSSKISADSGDTYDSIWRKIFKRIRFDIDQRQTGFNRPPESTQVSLADYLSKEVELNPDDILLVFERMSRPFLVVIDEFDRVVDQRARSLIADTIKLLSDTGLSVTILIVGVARTVSELIGEHPSIERNLRQIEMPVMSQQELVEIIDKGLDILKLSMDNKVKTKIASISQGFPHYTHLLAKYSVERALSAGRNEISSADFDEAITGAVSDTHETIRETYQKATLATKATEFPYVLLAAASANTDESGTFRATDLIAPLERITRRPWKVPNFTYHLGKLCSLERGNILEKLGTPKRYRYRFTNPLMRPYILMKGYSQGDIEQIPVR